MDLVSSYGVLVILGVLPSILWLAFYLQKDDHPEPKYLIIKVFLMGIILSPVAVALQLLFVSYVGGSTQGNAFLIWGAFVEELVKFGAVAFLVLRDPEFDEPVDAMIYLITAALGFAAMENILVLFRVIPDGVTATASVLTLRFMGATLLHALSSALLGYFAAVAWFLPHHRRSYIAIGIVFATAFHYTFNILLSASASRITSLGYATGLLVIMAFLVSILFAKIKERHAQRTVKLA